MEGQEIMQTDKGTVPGGIAIALICVVIFGLSQLHGQRLRHIEQGQRDHLELKLAERIATLEAHRTNDDLTDQDLLEDTHSIHVWMQEHDLRVRGLNATQDQRDIEHDRRLSNLEGRP